MKILEIIKAIIFGIIEGVSEWLPISSSGHLIIFESILDVKSIYGVDFWNFFLVFIQLGAILAVIIKFFNKLNPINKDNKQKKNIYKLYLKIIIGCIPACIIGLFFNDFIEKYLSSNLIVAITLIFYGIIFIIVEIINSKRNFTVNSINELTYKKSFIIGLFQSLSLISGTSRSGITIIGATSLKCNRKVACEYSFFLSIPIMIGASLLKSIKFISNNTIYLNQLIFLIVGFLTSFLTSILMIRFLLKYINNHDFKLFGVYRIILGIILLLYFI